MQKLLIVDASSIFTDALKEVFQNEFQLHICHDGETALEAMLSFQPDALVINLILPYKDGLTVLQESAHKPKVILAMVPNITDYVAVMAERLDIDYVMVMPKISTLRVRLMDLVANATHKSMDSEAQTAVHLHALNFPTHLDGYRQLCVAVPLFAANPNMRLSKELYPAIAKHFDLPDARTVEHSIRKAIGAAWSKKNPSVWTKYLPPKADGTIPCPSNKAFISRLAEMLVLENPPQV